MIFEDNYGVVDDNEAKLHAKIWDFCVNEMENLIKDGYLVNILFMKGRRFFGKWYINTS